ncbi:Uncharacterized protein dnm_088140 [Desulfonema magnum]|uniref:Uncharacterized protein n=1 Tax=Desulfonema magnum TaxID=45655 RepID=A0A975BX07_9BACT|nr:Uncharacterized protein dnm_088140 [Desulfonema magnum]
MEIRALLSLDDPVFFVIPAKAGIHSSQKCGIGQKRIPAFAGFGVNSVERNDRLVVRVRWVPLRSTHPTFLHFWVFWLMKAETDTHFELKNVKSFTMTGLCFINF